MENLELQQKLKDSVIFYVSCKSINKVFKRKRIKIKLNRIINQVVKSNSFTKLIEERIKVDIEFKGVGVVNAGIKEDKVKELFEELIRNTLIAKAVSILAEDPSKSFEEAIIECINITDIKGLVEGFFNTLDERIYQKAVEEAIKISNNLSSGGNGLLC